MTRWIEHVGNDCPVADDTLVEIAVSNGPGVATTTQGPMPACLVAWGEGLGPRGEGRVVRYRVVRGEAPAARSAQEFLARAGQLMEQRGKDYDKPEGERSVGSVVAAFNAVTGRDLTESEGWMLLLLLKLVRDSTTARGHADSQDDLVAYAALWAEARRAVR